MPYITDLTPAQLRASTKTQIITSIRDHLTANYTKRQLIRFLLDKERDEDTPDCTYYPDGQIKKMICVERDIETGERTGGTVYTWDYRQDGTIHYIKVSIRDAADNEIECYRIRHAGNGNPVIVPCA
jgi:hypothetical protein